jgi:hypothetical protein
MMLSYGLLQNSLLAFIAFLGILIGAVLSMIAPEEVRPYSRQFRILFAVLLSLLAYTLLSSLGMFYIISAFIAIILFFTFHRYISGSIRARTIAYNASALLLGATLGMDYAYIYSLIFLLLLGLAEATLVSGKYISKDRLPKKASMLSEQLRRHVLFLPLALVSIYIRLMLG